MPVAGGGSGSEHERVERERCRDQAALAVGRERDVVDAVEPPRRVWLSILDPGLEPEEVHELREPEVTTLDREGDRHSLRAGRRNRLGGRDALDPDAARVGRPRKLPEDLRHLHVVRDRAAKTAKVSDALLRRRALHERPRRGELDVRVADLSVECRSLRALGRHEHEPACQDDDEQPWDRRA